MFEFRYNTDESGPWKTVPAAHVKKKVKGRTILSTDVENMSFMINLSDGGKLQFLISQQGTEVFYYAP